jgi:class 3 adenylate cyclase/DNA-binding winged helix-turn-helix (wHTH) protein/tetratricopeptide (TPR) repeat protein
MGTGRGSWVGAVTMIYVFGEYTFDTQLYELRRAGELIHLGPQVFDVLAYLVQHRQRVVPKQELFERLWPGQFVGDDALERCIRAARRALGDTRHVPQLIQTIRGRGYRFMALVEVRRHDTPGDEGPAALPTLPLPVPQAVDGADMGLPSLPIHVGADTHRTTPRAPEGEHKPVTVLCCELAEAKALVIRLGPEAMHHLMQAVFALAQEVVQRYEGTIVQFGGDGFQALFGADVAQEDHARRAILAAVALQQQLDDRLATAGLPSGQAPAVGIGLHTGVVVVGRLGADPQRIYTAAGDTTALASRLQHLAAPGAILMSEATWQLVQDEVHVEPRGAIAVEEQPTPVPAYAFCRIARRRSGVPWRGMRARSRFVGRAREMALLQERLAHVQDGRGQVVGIAGDSGIGKSRVLEEFCRSLVGKRVTYCAGHCLSYGNTTPYLPVLDLLRQLCRITDADPPQAVTAQVRQHLEAVGLDPEEAAPYLLHLLGITAGTEQITALSPEEYKTRTFARLRQFSLQRSWRQPLIMAVENLHWIDATSEEYLTSLVERLAGAPILLLATYRPGYRLPWLEKSYAAQLALPGLTSRDSRVVVQSVLQTTPLSDVLRREIVGKAAGNPFFLEELTRAVVAEGDRPQTLVVPDTVHAVLAARMDRLPPEEKHLLQTAAVIGMDVSLPLLQAVAKLPDDALSRGLAHLQAAEFLYETRLFPDHAYTFKHALTQQVAYETLLQERRRALHARIVEALEALAGDRVVEQVERLAHHALRGEVWDKSVAYGRQAGEKALARSAHREAVGSFEQALSALPHLLETRDTREQAIDLRLALRSALLPSGALGRILTLLCEAESLAAALNDPRRLGQVSIFLSDHFYVLGTHDQAIAAAQRALAHATAGEEVVLYALANLYLARAYHAQGNYQGAINCFGQTVASLDGARRRERFGLPILPAVASRAWLAACHAEPGTFAEGEALAEEGLRIAEVVAHPASLMVVSWGGGLLSLRQGDLPKAIPRLERAVGLCREAELRLFLPWTAAHLGAAYTLGGRVADAVALLTQVMEQTNPIEMVGDQPLYRLPLGEAQVLAGRPEEAYVLAERALALAQEHNERGNQAYALRLLGDIAARREPPEATQAEGHYRQALALAEELGMRPLVAHCHRDLGILYRKTGRLEQAGAELTTAIELYRAMEMTFWLHPAETALAQVEGRSSHRTPGTI